MGNKTPPPARRSPAGSTMTPISGSNHSAPPSPAAEGPLLRCPACTRTVRAPAGAQRFRCPCGRVLAQPSLPNSSSSGGSNIPSSSSNNGGGPSNNIGPLPSQTRTIPPQQPSPTNPLQGVTRSIPPAAPNAAAPPGNNATPMRVRCPSCQQILLAPNARKWVVLILFKKKRKNNKRNIMMMN